MSPVGLEDMYAHLVDQRYRIIRTLAAGTSARVYLAEDLASRRQVALKLVPDRPELVDALKNEFGILSRLSYPNIRKAWDLGFCPIFGHYLSNEYIHGTVFSALVGLLPIARLATILRQLALSLEYLSTRGILHRDINPENILIRSDEAGLSSANPPDHRVTGPPVHNASAVLIDFGFAGPRQPDASLVARGTLPYVAPEILSFSSEDARSDIFSLGRTILHAAQQPPSTPNDSLDPLERAALTLSHVLAKMTQPDPSSRFATAGEIIAALSNDMDLHATESPDGLRSYFSMIDLQGRSVQVEASFEALDDAKDIAASVPPLGPRLFLVAGETGVGKSRFLEEVRCRAQLVGMRTLHISCNPHGLDPLDHLLQLTAPYPAAQCHSVAPTSNQPPTPRFWQGLSESAEVSLDGTPSSHQSERLHALHSLSQRLHLLSAIRPILLVIEDLHCADTETLELIRLIAAQPRGPLLFASYRTDLPRDSPLDSFLRCLISLPTTRHLQLDRLTEVDTQRLISKSIGPVRNCPALAHRLHSLTGGNPLLIEESLLSLAKARIIEKQPGGWRLHTDDIDALELPGSLRAFAQKLIRPLPSKLRCILEVIAVHRTRISRSFLTDLLGREPAALGLDIDALIIAGILSRVISDFGELFDFRHQCVRDIVYEELRADRRREIHRGIARLMERATPPTYAATQIDLLAYHYLEALDVVKGPDYAFAAADHAVRNFAAQSAIDLLIKGLDLTPKDDITRRFFALEKVASLLAVAGYLGRAEQFYFEMLILARTVGASEKEAHAIREISRCLLECGEMQRGLAYAMDAQLRFEALGDSAGEITSMMLRALAYVKLGNLRDATEVALKGYDRSVAASNLRNQAFAKTLFALIATDRGQHLEAIQLHEEALELSYKANDLNGIAVSLSNIGFAYLEQNLLIQASAFFSKALDEARARGLSLAANLACTNLGEVHRLRGDLCSAEALFNEALAIAEVGSRRHFAAYAKYSLGVCRLMEGDFSSAASHLAQAEAYGVEVGSRPNLALVLVSKAETLLALDKRESARKACQEALRLAEEAANAQAVTAGLAISALARIQDKPLEAGHYLTAARLTQARKAGKTQSLARLLEARAALRLAQSEATLALVDLSEMRSIAEETGLRPELARAALLEGQALMQLNRRAEARLALDAGVVLAREMGLRPLLSHLLYWLSQAQEAAGDAAGAADSIFESADLINTIGGAIAEDDLRRSYIRAPTSIAVLSRAERLERAGMRPRSASSTAPTDPDELAGAVFSDVGRELGTGASLRGLLTAVFDKAIEAVRADRGMLILLDPLEAEVIIARNLEGKTLGDAADYCRSILQDVARGDPILAMDVPGDERFRTRKSVTLYHIQSLMCVPLKLGERVLGALYFDSRSGRRLFREEDLHLMQAFAGRVAEAISEAQHEQRLREGAVVQNRELAKRYHMDNLVGESPVMQRLFRMMETVIRADCNVLVVGESGTGKELVARAVHFGSSRRLANFVPLDCGAIPESLVESELFGYRRGAFTGAECDKKGLFEEADGGTLFLDEITNTSPAFQAKLLRALQSGEFRRLGETLTRRADVRIIAATNAQVDRAIKEGRFREDLYYRLNVVTLTVPPLRDRKDDIPLLSEHFARRRCESSGIRFEGVGRGALARLQAHTWPGNVRELEHCIEAALVVSGDGMVRRESLPERVLGGELDQVRDLLREEGSLENSQRPEPVREERTLVEEALIRACGDKSRAARLLGWNRMRLYRRMKALGISYDVGKQTA